MVSTLAPDAHLPWRAVPGSAGVRPAKTCRATRPAVGARYVILSEQGERRIPLQSGGDSHLHELLSKSCRCQCRPIGGSHRPEAALAPCASTVCPFGRVTESFGTPRNASTSGFTALGFDMPRNAFGYSTISASSLSATGLLDQLRFNVVSTLDQLLTDVNKLRI